MLARRPTVARPLQELAGVVRDVAPLADAVAEEESVQQRFVRDGDDGLDVALLRRETSVDRHHAVPLAGAVAFNGHVDVVAEGAVHEMHSTEKQNGHGMDPMDIMDRTDGTDTAPGKNDHRERRAAGA